MIKFARGPSKGAYIRGSKNLETGLPHFAFCFWTYGALGRGFGSHRKKGILARVIAKNAYGFGCAENGSAPSAAGRSS